jgi:N-acetylglucosaminyl-diphospho-decaprenol L-rhamnosyltransferase
VAPRLLALPGDCGSAPPRNLGFGSACNLGAAGAVTPFLLFLNPDVRLRLDTVVPALSGAAMMVRRAAFEAVGGFDPRIFLYYGDDDLSLRLRAGQGPLVFVPSAVVTHFSGQSSPPSAALSRFKGYHWARSRIHAARKHGAAFPRLSGFANALWHLVSPRSWRSAERRNEAIGRLRGALSMLWT